VSPPILKTGRFVLKAYRQWVTQQPCAFCSSTEGSEPHHVLAKGPQGTHLDFTCVPACHRCHMRCDGQTVEGRPPIRQSWQMWAVGQTLVRFIQNANKELREAFSAEWERFAESRGPWEVPS